MRVVIVSDVHYAKGFRGDVDESRAWRWLLSVVDMHGPDLLVGLGDWGEDVGEEEFRELLERVRVWSIYGNHENMEILKRMCNALGDRCEPVLFEDGEVREFGGLRFGAINGVIALRRREKRGVPRKSLEEFVEIAKRLRGRIDVLLIHESPKLPLPEYSFMAEDGRAQAVEAAIREAMPRIVFCGHLHIEKPYTIHRLDFGALYVRIDSSQRHRCYAVLDTNSLVIEIWRDGERIYMVEAHA